MKTILLSTIFVLFGLNVILSQSKFINQSLQSTQTSISEDDNLRPPIFPGCEKLIKYNGDEIESCFKKQLSTRIVAKVDKNHVVNNELYGSVYFNYIINDKGEFMNIFIYGSENLIPYLSEKFYAVLQEMKDSGERIEPALNLQTGEYEWMTFTTGITFNKKAGS